MATVVDVVSAQIEKVRDKLEMYFESSDQIAGLIKKAGADKVEVSRYLYRIPVMKWRGGHFHKVNLDGGSFGTGTGMNITHLTAGYYTSARSYQITDEQVNTSDDTTKSVVNVFQRTLADAMLEAQIDDDICFHGDGTGKLTNPASSSPSSNQLVFAGATDYLGVGKLREGMSVDVWDSTGSTKRANGPYQIVNIDYSSKTVTFGSAVTGITGTDLLAISDADEYGPATLTSFSSTWPGGGLTNGPGLTGDSFRHGLYYANDATAANYYLGRQKSAFSQLMPTRVNAANSALVFPHGNLLIDGIYQRRDKDVVKGLIGVAHMAQRSQVFNIGIAISNWNRSKSDKMIDVMPSGLGYDETFDFCGIKCYLSKRQDRSRFDFFNPKNWGRVQTHDTKFKEVGGKTVFEVRNGDGNLTAAVEFHIVQSFDFVCFDPGAGAYISDLSLPTGY
jgi:hypothetical protein